MATVLPRDEFDNPTSWGSDKFYGSFAEGPPSPIVILGAEDSDDQLLERRVDEVTGVVTFVFNDTMLTDGYYVFHVFNATGVEVSNSPFHFTVFGDNFDEFDPTLLFFGLVALVFVLLLVILIARQAAI